MSVKGGAVYVLTNRSRRVLYTGVTSCLTRRVAEHRLSIDPKAFTTRYRVDTLIYFELHADIREAIRREKTIKGWVRRKKVRLIEAMNPRWDDLWDQIVF